MRCFERLKPIFRVATLSPFSTRRICSREQTKKKERFLLVRGEFFRQPILTNHVAGFLFSLRVARTNLPSGKRALFARREAKTRIRQRDWLKLAGEKIRREQAGSVPTFLSVCANKVAKWKIGFRLKQIF